MLDLGSDVGDHLSFAFAQVLTELFSTLQSAGSCRESFDMSGLAVLISLSSKKLDP